MSSEKDARHELLAVTRHPRGGEGWQETVTRLLDDLGLEEYESYRRPGCAVIAATRGGDEYA